ncbi:MAG: methyltransferase [Candidatus Micrarchaeota archaeon]|nr:methyltransferase [Candidatus Micrarchaeota archaeon]
MSLLDLLRLRKKRGQKPDDSGFSIEERGYEKVLKYEGITYSKLKDKGVYTGEYWDYFIPAANIFYSPRVLLIGLGGGTIALQLGELMRNRIDLDVVELNKRSVELSHEFAPRISANIMLGEGSDYVETTNKKYDAILLDAYISSKIPGQFLERKFIENAHRALSDDGVLAINYAMNFMGVLTFRDYVHKLKERFSVFKVNTAMFEGNVILLCSKRLGKGEMLIRIAENLGLSPENEPLVRNYRSMDRL